jgi:hypothetical protein
VAKARSTSLGVDWHLPDGKGSFKARRFATTTSATSALIEALAGDGHTVQSAHNAVLFDDDAKTVLAGFIEAGYGPTTLTDHVRAR